MHEIVFYRTNKGCVPVLEYIKELAQQNSKDARIKFTKLNDYIQALSVYGVENLPV